LYKFIKIVTNGRNTDYHLEPVIRDIEFVNIMQFLGNKKSLWELFLEKLTKMNQENYEDFLSSLSKVRNKHIIRDEKKALEVLSTFNLRPTDWGSYYPFQTEENIELLNEITPREMQDEDLWNLFLYGRDRFGKDAEHIDRYFAPKNTPYGFLSREIIHEIEQYIGRSYVNFLKRYGKRIALIKKYLVEMSYSTYAIKIVNENFWNLEIDPRLFNRLTFHKTGSGLVPLGGKFKTKIMVRIIPEWAYQAWKKAQDNGDSMKETEKQVRSVVKMFV